MGSEYLRVSSSLLKIASIPDIWKFHLAVVGLVPRHYCDWSIAIQASLAATIDRVFDVSIQPRAGFFIPSVFRQQSSNEGYINFINNLNRPIVIVSCPYAVVTWCRMLRRLANSFISMSSQRSTAERPLSRQQLADRRRLFCVPLESIVYQIWPTAEQSGFLPGQILL